MTSGQIETNQNIMKNFVIFICAAAVVIFAGGAYGDNAKNETSGDKEEIAAVIVPVTNLTDITACQNVSGTATSEPCLNPELAALRSLKLKKPKKDDHDEDEDDDDEDDKKKSKGKNKKEKHGKKEKDGKKDKEVKKGKDGKNKKDNKDKQEKDGKNKKDSDSQPKKDEDKKDNDNKPKNNDEKKNNDDKPKPKDDKKDKDNKPKNNDEKKEKEDKPKPKDDKKDEDNKPKNNDEKKIKDDKPKPKDDKKNEDNKPKNNDKKDKEDKPKPKDDKKDKEDKPKPKDDKKNENEGKNDGANPPTPSPKPVNPVIIDGKIGPIVIENGTSTTVVPAINIVSNPIASIINATATLINNILNPSQPSAPGPKWDLPRPIFAGPLPTGQRPHPSRPLILGPISWISMLPKLGSAPGPNMSETETLDVLIPKRAPNLNIFGSQKTEVPQPSLRSQTPESIGKTTVNETETPIIAEPIIAPPPITPPPTGTISTKRRRRRQDQQRILLETSNVTTVNVAETPDQTN